MRKIKQGDEPNSLTRWKRQNPQRAYGQLSEEIRREIHQYLLDNQFNLCAYCCDRIQSINDCHNEHLEAKQSKPNRDLDFTNLVASCNTKNQCGNAHGTASLPITPLQEACETELAYQLSGRVKGLTNQATETLAILNLNNKSLIEKRKQITHCILWGNNLNPTTIQLTATNLLGKLANDLAMPKDGKLEAFSPVVVNVLRQL